MEANKTAVKNLEIKVETDLRKTIKYKNNIKNLLIQADIQLKKNMEVHDNKLKNRFDRNDSLDLNS